MNQDRSRSQALRRALTARPSFAFALASLATTFVAAPATAECAIGRWPSFERAARTADQVLVGEVTEGLRKNSVDLIIAFRFRVDEVLRGTSPDEVVFEWPITQRRSLCGVSLPVQVGDRLALAFKDPVGSQPPRAVVGVPAFLNRDPGSGGRIERESHLGLKRMSLREVRELVALPETDAAIGSGSTAPAGDLRVAPLAALVIAFGASLWLIPRRMARRRSS